MKPTAASARGDETQPMRIVKTDRAPSHLSFMSQAIAASGLVFAVTVPREAGTNEVPTTFDAQATLAFDNLQAVLEAAGTGFEHLVRLTVWLTDMERWSAMNEVYLRYIDEARPPVRLAAQPARLNGSYMIELDAVAVDVRSMR